MRAAVVRSVGGPESVEVLEVPRPVPGPLQVLIRVAAAGLNPADVALWSGAFGPIPDGVASGIGFDVSGTVVDKGALVGDIAVGADVIAIVHRADLPVRGQAEFVAVDSHAVAPAPTLVDAVGAATLPLNSLTALRLLDAVALHPGQSVLVTGAAGAVGGFAVQLARVAGVRTIGVAGADDADLVTGTLGATWFVDRAAPLAEAVRELVPGGVDAAVDAALIGGQALSAVRDNGRFASANPVAGPPSERGIEVFPVSAQPDGRRLALMAHLADVGLLTPRVAEVFALGDAAKAHARLAAGHLRGRLVLVP